MKVLILLIFFSLITSISAAQGIDNNGNCNANINGSGNNIKIDCSGNRKAPAVDKIRLVITKNNIPIIQGFLNWQFVVPSQSDFTLNIDDDQIVYQSLDDVFDDERLTLDRGQHFYTMEASITFINGFSDTVSCSGVIDAQVSAAIVPRLQISQNPQTGSLYSMNCGFTLR